MSGVRGQVRDEGLEVRPPAGTPLRLASRESPPVAEHRPELRHPGSFSIAGP